MIALTSWFYAFWRCKNTKISENTQIFLVKILENTQIFLVKILENTQIFLVKILENTQIRRDGKQCKNTNNFLKIKENNNLFVDLPGNIWYFENFCVFFTK